MRFEQLHQRGRDPQDALGRLAIGIGGQVGLAAERGPGVEGLGDRPATAGVPDVGDQDASAAAGPAGDYLLALVGRQDGRLGGLAHQPDGPDRGRPPGRHERPAAGHFPAGLRHAIGLRRTVLRRTVLHGAVLHGASLYWAVLYWASLYWAVLYWASLYWAVLYWAGACVAAARADQEPGHGYRQRGRQQQGRPAVTPMVTSGAGNRGEHTGLTVTVRTIGGRTRRAARSGRGTGPRRW